MKKKLLTLGLSSTLTLSATLPALADTVSSDVNTEKTYIETAIGFKYHETKDYLKSRNLKATLKGNNIANPVEIDLNQLLDNSISTFNVEGYTVTSEIIEESNKIKTILFKIDGLEAQDGYTLEVTGKNYAKTTVNLSTTTYSKRVNISTASNLVLGDVNEDGKVDVNDRKLLEENLNTQNTEIDLNDDGEITIADIAMVNSNMVIPTQPKVMDTEIVASKIEFQQDFNNIKTDPENNINEIQGDVSNLFSSNSENVTFIANPENINSNINIPLDFKEPVEMASIEVKIPTGIDDAIISVYDDNNNLITDSGTPVVAAYSMTRNANENVVTVNLGSRKPVKKIVISAKPSDEGIVTVEEVKIIGDIISDDIVQDNTIKYVKAIPGNEQVELSWGSVNNATAYKVYYGTDANDLNQTKIVSDTKATISGLENLQTYYFSISALLGTNQEFEGNKSSVVSAIPKPASKPLKPDFVETKPKDRAIDVSWKATENATSYNVYYKKATDNDYTKVASNITQTNYTISNLENNVEYIVYVTAVNNIGESDPSNLSSATPKKEEIKEPTLPTLGKIVRDEIESVSLSGNGQHYNKNLYPNGFNPESVIDGNFNTDWVAGHYNSSNTFTFTFKKSKTMDYLIWVPRLDGNYRQSNQTYNITVWTEDNLDGEGANLVSKSYINNRFDENSYYVLTFPKTDNIKKIAISLGEKTGGPRVNASEIAFYEYNDITNRVDMLFSNSSKTELNKEYATEQKINELKAEVSNLEGFVLNRDILEKEISIAEALLKNGNTQGLSIIKSDLYSVNRQADIDNYNKAINDWQPLGVVANAGEKVTIYADIPDDETVYLVPTQFHDEVKYLSANPIPLKNGRNTITIPKIGSYPAYRGGSLYVTYNGANANKIKLQLVGGKDIPYLELNNFHTINEDERKRRIGEFIKELETLNSQNLPNLSSNNLNHCEISLPNVLLSLPANQVLAGINAGDSDKVQSLYDNIQAWEELMGIMYKTYGIDDHINASLETRHNIRYMQMFSKAFMYAAGNHIGVGYGSVPDLMKGKPTTSTGSGNPNNLFGWGIAHEIGHVMDAFGKAEVTNNIYSLVAQTYDGDKNIGKSRLEGGAYKKAFQKVAVGEEGLPNDLFVHLAMYWQLHLAYDDKDSTEFYNKVHKKYRDSSLNSFTDMDKFAVAASQVSGKNLTEFFTRWGVSLSEPAKAEMAEQGKEDRAVYYLSDESRRVRLNNTFVGDTNITATATATLQDDNGNTPDNKSKAKKVVINITNPSIDTNNIQGYEILRKGTSDAEYTPIGFTTTNTYTDYIGSANNMVFEYAIKPVDILGNVSPQIKIEEQVRISYDNTIEGGYEIDENSGIVTFTSPTTVTGVKITPKDGQNVSTNGTFNVYGNIVGDVAPTSAQPGETLIKEIDFAKNNFASNTTQAYLTYFNKPGSTDDKIWAYDVTSLRLENFDFKTYNIEFLSYPGDNIEFMEMGIGRLANDYVYDSVDENNNPIQDKIDKDSLVIVGKYRGNSLLSNIYINGKYPKQNSLNESIEYETRPVNGYTLMFDTLDEDGKITSSTAEGIFIFVPELQKDTIKDDSLESENLDIKEQLSQLPTEIMAEMWHVNFNGSTYDKLYKTSDTVWIPMPTDESLPKIVIQGEQKNLKVDFK